MFMLFNIQEPQRIQGSGDFCLPMANISKTINYRQLVNYENSIRDQNQYLLSEIVRVSECIIHSKGIISQKTFFKVTHMYEYIGPQFSIFTM